MSGPPAPGRVVVVGAGLAGLAAACHLAGRGHEVVVVERGDGPGGRAGRIHRGGYAFDTGPTVLTMPGLLAEVFTAAGVRMADLLTLRPVDPAYRATFADGTALRVHTDPDRMAAEIRAVAGPAEAAAYHRFRRWLTDLYAVEMPGFIDRDYSSPLDLLRAPGAALRLLRLGGTRRLGSVVAGHFADERLRRLFSFQALYAGLSPLAAPAVYGSIAYMDTVAGVSFPVGGIHAVPTALAAAAEKAGARLRYANPATGLLRRADGSVRAVRLAGGETVAADAVVCTVDLPTAYRDLLTDLRPPRWLRAARYSPSCVVWHAGVADDLPAGVAHHNVHFGADWAGAFAALLDRGQCMPDPSVLVSVPTVSDPTLAPAGRAVLYALEPVPNLHGRVAWRSELPRLRDRLVDRLAALGYPVDAAEEVLVGPPDWLAAGMAAGTPFALAHTWRQTGPFRPAPADRRVPGLVFAGSATRPGVGVPMVLLSGRLAADRVERHLAARGSRR